jgi:tetratricopeptide (TPR) repeat protein
MDIKKIWGNYYKALEQNEWANALSALGELEEKKPRDPQVHLKIGDILRRMHNRSGAIESYHKAALYLVKEGFLQKAIGIFKIILQLDPDNSEAAVKLKKVFEFAASAQKGFAALKSEDISSVTEMTLNSIEIPDLKTDPEVLTERNLEDFDDLLKDTERGFDVLYQHKEIPEGCPVCFLPLGIQRAFKFIRKAPSRLYKSGERIINEGEYGNALYFIKTGAVKITVHVHEIVITRLKEDDLFGEMTYLTGRNLTASAVAAEDCEILEFNQPLIVEAITENPEVLECLNDLYLSRFSETIQKIAGD